MACNFGHKDVVQLLLDHSDPNIELNAKDEDGTTALNYAFKQYVDPAFGIRSKQYCQYKDIVELLLVKLVMAKLNQMEAPQKPVHQMMTRQKTKMIKAKLNQ